MIDPGHIGLGRRVVLGIRDESQGVDHRVRVELLAVVEFDALAQLEFERAVVDLLEALGKLAFIFACHRVTKQQRIPDVGPQDHANAHVVEIRVDVFRCLVVGHAQRVGLLVGGCRRRKRRTQRKRGHAGPRRQPAPEGVAQSILDQLHWFSTPGSVVSLFNNKARPS